MRAINVVLAMSFGLIVPKAFIDRLGGGGATWSTS
jgi:hypothetical protein